ncbi:fatty acid desaturase [Verrucomicrobia bacterium LW23]|nr:fatty acid desaturase [Verrucomicrobia bacterium LW23]
MRTGKDLILATKPFAVDDALTSWWVILSTVFLYLTAVVIVLRTVQLPIQLLFSVLTGLLIVRLFVINHDLQHQTLLPKSWLAGVVMRVMGIWLLSPTSIWKSSHNHHHKHNSRMRGSQIGSFPVMTKELFEASSRAVQRQYLLMRHPLTILFGYISAFLLGMCLFPFVSKPREHFDCFIALAAHFAFGAFLICVFGWSTWMYAQVFPCFIAYGLGAYLFYAQHNFPGVTFLDGQGWTYEKAAMESSSYMKMGLVMAWFTGNIGYHHIHHLNAHIPFYRLPEVWRKVPELQRARTTSLHPYDIIRCLRLKVWDAKAQKMVAL